MEAVVKCKVSTHNNYTSDHLAIETSLNLQILKVEQTQRLFNYEKTDWKNIEQILPTIMPPILDSDTATKGEVDNFATEISKALHQAISETTL